MKERLQLLQPREGLNLQMPAGNLIDRDNLRPDGIGDTTETTQALQRVIIAEQAASMPSAERGKNFKTLEQTAGEHEIDSGKDNTMLETIHTVHASSASNLLSIPSASSTPSKMHRDHPTSKKPLEGSAIEPKLPVSHAGRQEGNDNSIHINTQRGIPTFGRLERRILSVTM